MPIPIYRDPENLKATRTPSPSGDTFHIFDISVEINFTRSFQISFLRAWEEHSKTSYIYLHNVTLQQCWRQVPPLHDQPTTKQSVKKSTSWAKAPNSPSNLPVSISKQLIRNEKKIRKKHKKIYYIQVHSSCFWGAQESDPFNAFIRRIIMEKKPFFEVVDTHEYPCRLSKYTYRCIYGGIFIIYTHMYMCMCELMHYAIVEIHPVAQRSYYICTYTYLYKYVEWLKAL